MGESYVTSHRVPETRGKNKKAFSDCGFGFGVNSHRAHTLRVIAPVLQVNVLDFRDHEKLVQGNSEYQ